MNDQRKPLEGKVAQVISERELAINIGARDGVKKGMKFAVLAPEPLVIRDPDTGETLGTVDRPKVKVQATEVGGRMTICATFLTRVVGGNSLLDVFASNPRREVPETLRAEDASLPQPLSPDESYIQIGDRVKEIGG